MAVQTKEELQATLAMSRASLIEMTDRLEEEIAKVAALEDMRIQDLQQLVRLEDNF
jgi:hypothetical protein